MAKGLKSLVVADEIKSDAALIRSVERATEFLIDELGQSSGLVDANWRCSGDDNGRRVVELQITDFTGSSVEQFTPDELDDGDYLRRRLYRLWGRLLREGSKRQLDRLHEIVQELEGS